MSEQRRGERVLASVTAGAVIGVLEVVVATSFSTLIFGGSLGERLGDGVGLYLAAAAVILSVIAWTAGGRGVVGSTQEGPAAILAVVATSVVAGLATDTSDTAFLTVVAVVLVATVLTGVRLCTAGSRRCSRTGSATCSEPWTRCSTERQLAKEPARRSLR